MLRHPATKHYAVACRTDVPLPDYLVTLSNAKRTDILVACNPEDARVMRALLTLVCHCARNNEVLPNPL